MNASPAVPPGRKPTPNKKSDLLTEEENQMVFKLTGTRVQVLASAVVQVYSTEPPHHNAWHRLHCGVACFSKDNNRRSYFIQVFDVAHGEQLFEQELYQHFEYHQSMPFFHQFEGDRSMIGLSFADEFEAMSFASTIQERIEAKRRRREEKKRLQSAQQQRLLQQQVLQPQSVSRQHMSFNMQGIGKQRNRNKKGRPIRKEEIGAPTNFQHVTHVGFDPDSGFSDEDLLKNFLKMVGVDDNNLDHNTRQFIYDFIDKNGGIENARRETQLYSTLTAENNNAVPSNKNNNNVLSNNSAADKPPPPPPPSAQHKVAPPPPVPSLPARNAPPPPPRTTYQHQPPPPPPSFALPPSKSTLAFTRGPPPVPTGPKSAAPPAPPPPPAGRGLHPPPPPPPPSCAHPALQEDQVAGGRAPPLPVVPDARSMLMDQIRSGTTLRSGDKKVEVEERTPVLDGRSQLLEDIRSGKKLKPVDLDHQSGSGISVGGEGALGHPLPPVAAALAAALQNRAKRIQDESSSDEEDSDDDDEDWDQD